MRKKSNLRLLHFEITLSESQGVGEEEITMLSGGSTTAPSPTLLGTETPEPPKKSRATKRQEFR